MRTKGKAKPKPEEHADQDDESTENKVYLYYFVTICYPQSLDLKTAFHQSCLQFWGSSTDS